MCTKPGGDLNVLRQLIKILYLDLQQLVKI